MNSCIEVKILKLSLIWCVSYSKQHEFTPVRNLFLSAVRSVHLELKSSGNAKKKQCRNCSDRDSGRVSKKLV